MAVSIGMDIVKAQNQAFDIEDHIYMKVVSQLQILRFLHLCI